jgi:hypothetical protein
MGYICSHEDLIKNSLPSKAFALIRHVTGELICVDSTDVVTGVFQNSKPNNDGLWAIGFVGASELGLVMNWSFPDVIAY